MNLIVPVALFLSVGFCTALTVHWAMRYLESRNIFDNPNARSSHVRPTLRGGGLGMLPVILIAWLIIGYFFNPSENLDLQSKLSWVILGALLLAAVSWSDDLRSLPPLFRLLAQFAATALVLWLTPISNPYFQGFMPPWLDRLAALIIWVWFINLFNFMDGIDGISGVEIAAIGIGVASLAYLGAISQTQGLLGLTAAASAIGFLRWNWPPAKVFLGDVGSVPFGFLLGWLLLQLAAQGLWAAAIILPLYYLMDATITLLRRAAKRERIWQAHRSHYYQQAIQRGLSHSAVSLAITLVNLALIGLAVFSVKEPWLALSAALIINIGLLAYFRSGAKS